MYTSIRHYKAKHGSADEVIRRAEDAFIPLVSNAPGFSAYYILNTGNDTLTTISIFGNRAQAEESNRMAVGWIKGENLGELLPEPPMILAGDVSAYKVK
jgi:hypothetical protein